MKMEGEGEVQGNEGMRGGIEETVEGIVVEQGNGGKGGKT